MEILIGILVCAIAAGLPTLVCSLVVWWADRYERESGWLMLIAFLWGSVPAVALSLIVQLIYGVIGAVWNADHMTFWAYVLWAPLTEEIFKAFALWGLFVFYRRNFDGVLDGLVYGMLIGFGFSMTEDFLYYVESLFDSGPTSFALLAMARGILFATNHSVYTGLVGVGFGLATLSKSTVMRTAWPLSGLLLAMFFHSLHNLGSILSGWGALPELFRGLSFVWTTAMSLSWVVILAFVIRAAWYHQVRVVREELSQEVGKILTACELDSLCRKWFRPVSLRKEERSRHRQLIQLALRRRRLQLAGQDNEPALKKHTLGEYESLKRQFPLHETS
jgi:RsiW-degrading membrane proteinase PrsW (M82 family)